MVYVGLGSGLFGEYVQLFDCFVEGVVLFVEGEVYQVVLYIGLL